MIITLETFKELGVDKNTLDYFEDNDFVSIELADADGIPRVVSVTTDLDKHIIDTYICFSKDNPLKIIKLNYVNNDLSETIKYDIFGHKISIVYKDKSKRLFMYDKNWKVKYIKYINGTEITKELPIC